jgi:sugar phosphate isomerase/epimerase
MRLALPGSPHLTYCTNIHAGESLDDVERIVREHVPRVRDRLGVKGPFGVGLRLSARAAEELDSPERLAGFKHHLATENLYVFTINGFPYGAFHGARVKESVYRPDWREDERALYTDRLARLLAALLPEGVDGSISTVPGAFAREVRDEADVESMRERLVRHAATLHDVRETTGKLVELALEPEPACFLETTDGTVRFFLDHVFSEKSAAELAALTGLSAGDAAQFLRRHLGVCLDACHFAVEYEDARDAVQAFRAAGIRIGKVQITAALVADFPGSAANAEATAALGRFADAVYFHQVVRRSRAGDEHFLDLPDALAAEVERTVHEPAEWRIHFHVPVFARKLGAFRSTQPFLRDLLDVVSREPVSPHLEVETYTWDVLPEEYRAGSVEDAIARELRFVLDEVFAGEGARLT